MSYHAGRWAMVFSLGPSFDCDSDDSHNTGIDKPGDTEIYIEVRTMQRSDYCL